MVELGFTPGTTVHTAGFTRCSGIRIRPKAWVNCMCKKGLGRFAVNEAANIDPKLRAGLFKKVEDEFTLGYNGEQWRPKYVY